MELYQNKTTGLNQRNGNWFKHPRFKVWCRDFVLLEKHTFVSTRLQMYLALWIFADMREKEIRERMAGFTSQYA